MRRFLLALTLATALPASSFASCLPSERAASIQEIVARVRADRLRYLFIGEQHGDGPVKRFAADLANALADAGHRVGLYVEGFRAGCRPDRGACESLARLFNEAAFLTLLAESRVAVHALDPLERDGRAARMATSIAQGPEPVRVILVGRVHVLHAGNPAAELWVYGGGMRYPDPGDVVEAFPRQESLTVALETAGDADAPYRLRRDGCAADYVLLAPDTRDYWGRSATRAGMAADAESAGR